jgi:hypothetical protein
VSPLVESQLQNSKEPSKKVNGQRDRMPNFARFSQKGLIKGQILYCFIVFKCFIAQRDHLFSSVELNFLACLAELSLKELETLIIR